MSINGRFNFRRTFTGKIMLQVDAKRRLVSAQPALWPRGVSTRRQSALARAAAMRKAGVRGPLREAAARGKEH